MSTSAQISSSGSASGSQSANPFSSKIGANQGDRSQIHSLVQQAKNAGASQDQIQQAFQQAKSSGQSPLDALQQLVQSLTSNGSNGGGQTSGQDQFTQSPLSKALSTI